MHLKNFIVIGTSHSELSLAERESFFKLNPIKKVEELYSRNLIEGYINVSTCLRMEIYIQLKEEKDIEILSREFNSTGVVLRRGEEAVNYLFRVICGFESVIKGEDQILAQIKKSHQSAMEKKTVTAMLNVIFNKAVELGKRFRHISGISRNALSLEAISLRFIKSQISDYYLKKVLILGIGDLSESILKLLLKDGTKDITITNRSYHKSIEVQRNYPVKVIGFDEKIERAIAHDIVISATSAPHHVIYEKEFTDQMDPQKKYLFLDLAVPRDIEEGLNRFDNIDLYNLDDVWNVYRNNVENRENLIKEHEYMIVDQLKNLYKWFEYGERKRNGGERKKCLIEQEEQEQMRL